jgi:hypothetical protein
MAQSTMNETGQPVLLSRTDDATCRTGARQEPRIRHSRRRIH